MMKNEKSGERKQMFLPELFFAFGCASCALSSKMLDTH